MKVLLIKMPFEEHEYVKFSEKWEYIEDEYIGIGIVESLLHQYHCEVFINTSTNTVSMCEEAIVIAPEVVMISVMQTSAKQTYDFTKLLREGGYKGKIFIGGWFAKMAWREIFAHKWPIDYVCFLDAEVCLPQWIEHQNKNIYGIATYNNWQYQSALRRNTQYPVQRYVRPCRLPGRHTYSLEMSRGCPHSRCTFCSQSCGNIFPDRWIPIPIQIIKSEIISLYNEFGVSRFATSDDDLLGPSYNSLNRAKEIRDMIKSLPFSISFSASISVRAACSEEIVDVLQDAGLVQLCVGFESADEQQLRRYGKQQRLEENFIAAENLSKRELNVLPGLITFDPYSSTDSIRKNLDFLFDNLKHYNISKLTKRLHLLTGSPFVRMCQKDNLLTGDYLSYDYVFKDECIKKIYNNFSVYVELVKDIERSMVKKPMHIASLIGNHHRKVAEHILQNNSIDQFILNEIESLKNLLVELK